MLKKILRYVLGFCGLLFGYGAASLLFEETGLVELLNIPNIVVIIATVLLSLLFGLIFLKLFDRFSSRSKSVATKVETDLQTIPVQDIMSAGGGLLAGLFAAYLISQIINYIPILHTAYINVIISVLLYVALGYFGFMFGKRLGKEGLGGRFFNAEKEAQKEPSRKQKGRAAAPKVFDTSVLIDGRVVDILKTGFIEGDIIIPDFVLVELRHIADSSDALKRARGRRGLEILNRIQSDYGVEIYDTEGDKDLAKIPEVDVKLIKLAQKSDGAVLTNDYNLNKVASIQGVRVLNINELANTLKAVVLPGEDMSIYLVKEGKEAGQGVAYLDDGTMIVVEDGRGRIGSTVAVTVTGVLQTSAGRMIFARLK